jgi:alpha-beta hydrolase superfamily lysophospholipase
MYSLDLDIDVTEAAGLGEPATLAVTVTLPDPGSLPAERPIVCFAKPGGGYSRGYYTVDLPGPARGAQADWHAGRGWIFVSVDHLGVGNSSTHRPADLDYTRLSATAHAAEREVLDRLAAGILADGFPAVTDPVVIGIGQSMGGCMTVVQQGRYESYDGIGVLGFSAVHTTPATLPGTTPIIPAWIPRDVVPTQWVQADPLSDPGVVNKALMVTDSLRSGDRASGPAMAWGFHYDDVDRAIVAQDLADFPTRNGNPPPWASTTLPATVAVWCIVPGAIAPEAAAVSVPVLVAMGERDVIADPKGEPRAYQSATSIDFFRCPRMGHMHNFAGTRELFWRRIEAWAEWVRIEKDARHRGSAPAIGTARAVPQSAAAIRTGADQSSAGGSARPSSRR